MSDAYWRAGTGTTQLIVSELISNAIAAHTACPEIVKAIRYADPDQIWMDLYRMGETVVLRVWDAGPLTPVVRDPTPDDENGRGLHLVDLLATDWGYHRPTPGGKIVWCTLTTPPSLSEGPENSLGRGAGSDPGASKPPHRRCDDGQRSQEQKGSDEMFPR
ncbi:ATP-binding protein [Streptosporangium amethystogenes]|uniref:ATP-binding protein n=1 Tax=Streptosporangium amethystogenes TaxID=2002 RepID=UPI00378AD71A